MSGLRRGPASAEYFPFSKGKCSFVKGKMFLNLYFRTVIKVLASLEDVSNGLDGETATTTSTLFNVFLKKKIEHLIQFSKLKKSTSRYFENTPLTEISFNFNNFLLTLVECKGKCRPSERNLGRILVYFG